MVKFLVIFLLPFIITKEKEFSLTDSILQWASKHNITISSKLTPEFLSVNHKKFRANSDITINETILSIPFDSIITPSKLLSLSTKKLKEIYTNMKTNNETKKIFRTASTQEQTFMALAHYISMTTKKSKKIKNEYGAYYDSYQDNIDSYPITFSEEELNLLTKTNLGFMISQAKAALNSELEYIRTNFNISSFIPEEFLRYRLLTVSKSYNIKNISSIVPLADFFPLALDDSIANVKWIYNDTTNIFSIFAIRPIKKEEVLKMKAVTMPNANYLLYYGVTFANNNYIQPMRMAVIHPRWKQSDNLTMTLPAVEFDLSDEGFIGASIESYRELGLRRYNMNNIDDTGYQLMLKNLMYYQEDYDSIKEKDFYDVVLLNENRINIRRVVDLEKLLLSNRIRLLKEIIDDREKERKKKKDL